MNNKVFQYSFASIYRLYKEKTEKKGRTAEEVDTVILWLTGYNDKQFRDQIEKKVDLETFFAEAPNLNPNASKITGLIAAAELKKSKIR